MAHILVVEDAPTDQFAIRSILETAGYDVSIASTADEGVQLARALQPDLITMDIVFEGQRGSSGFMGVRKIKRDPDSANIPVVIISSKSLPTDRAWALRQGADEYVVKPVSAENLLPVIEALLAPGGDPDDPSDPYEPPPTGEAA
ncbi:MAG: response regulator [Salinisphaeraceae bacterium]|nr:response regulator [Salinisphaeraceae bacterium]